MEPKDHEDLLFKNMCIKKEFFLGSFLPDQLGRNKRREMTEDTVSKVEIMIKSIKLKQSSPNPRCPVYPPSHILGFMWIFRCDGN